ncbi:MAG: hypothetical protein RL173_1575 [Fibrobacterota bacterium]|jgi:hypothetical protein
MRAPTLWLVAAFAVAIEAQTVNLHGIVSSTGGQPVAGAIVTLRAMALKDTTGSDGSYSIVNSLVSISPLTRPGRMVRLNGNILSIDLETPSKVEIEIIEANGHLVSRQSIPDARSGQFRLGLDAGSGKTDLLLVQVTIGSETATFRTLPWGDGRVASSQASTTAVDGIAARKSAIPDTLLVTATGYVGKSVAIPSYEQTINVVLEPLAVCNPADRTADPVTVNSPNTGSPVTGSLEAVVETDAGLSSHTIYRPKILGAGKNYPILIWGNGACATDGTAHPEFFKEIVSHGYVVLVDGKPKGTGGHDMGSPLATLGKPLLDALTWATGQNKKPCSRFYQSLDTTRVGAFGWSCGGLMAYGASPDPRVDAVIIMSSGLLNPDQTVLDKVHTPIAYVCGGSEDIAFANCARDYKNMKTQPAILANDPVGHGGTYYGDNGGSFAKIAIAWFDWWLKGETSIKAKFTGASCTFCKSPWTLETKNLP